MVNKKIRTICCLLSIVMVLSVFSCERAPKTTEIDTMQGSNAEQSGTNSNNDKKSDINGDLKALTMSHEGYSLTREDSEKLFNIGRDFNFSSIRDFAGERPDLLSFACYVAVVFNNKYKRQNQDGTAYVDASSINEVAQKYFGFKYELADNDKVELPLSEYTAPPMIDFVRYEVEDTAEGKKVTVVGRDLYSALSHMANAEEQEKLEVDPTLYYADDPKDPLYVYMGENGYTNVFQATKELIVSGKADLVYGEDIAIRVSYLSDDGYTPKKFLSFESYRSGWK